MYAGKYVRTYINTYICTCIRAYITYIHTYLHTYVYMYVRSCVQTYVHKYILTNILTYMDIHIRMCGRMYACAYLSTCMRMHKYVSTYYVCIIIKLSIHGNLATVKSGQIPHPYPIHRTPSTVEWWMGYLNRLRYSLSCSDLSTFFD